jgi:uridine kinase
MDNFYRSLRDDEDGGSYNWDAVDAIDVDQLVRCITFWRDGLACWVPRHDFAAYKSIPHDKYIISTGIIIIEGIHALSIAKLLPLADIKIFVSCDQDEALARRIMRDTTERGHTLELIISRYFTYVKPAFTNVIAGSRAYADYVIMNNNGTDLDNLLTPLAGVITHHYL